MECVIMKKEQCSICGSTINLVEVKDKGYPSYLICKYCLEEQQAFEGDEDVLKFFFED